MSNRARELNLTRAATQLAQAQRIVQDMMDNNSDVFNITDCPAGGVRVLEKLKIIEIFNHDTLTHMDNDGEQRPRIVAIARS